MAANAALTSRCDLSDTSSNPDARGAIDPVFKVSLLLVTLFNKGFVHKCIIKLLQRAHCCRLVLDVLEMLF